MSSIIKTVSNLEKNNVYGLLSLTNESQLTCLRRELERVSYQTVYVACQVQKLYEVHDPNSSNAGF